jgi:hypothetical protein
MLLEWGTHIRYRSAEKALQMSFADLVPNVYNADLLVDIHCEDSLTSLLGPSLQVTV